MAMLSDNQYGFMFGSKKDARDWLDLPRTQKAVWISPGGDVWIGDNPGTGFLEISHGDLYE